MDLTSPRSLAPGRSPAGLFSGQRDLDQARDEEANHKGGDDGPDRAFAHHVGKALAGGSGFHLILVFAVIDAAYLVAGIVSLVLCGSGHATPTCAICAGAIPAGIARLGLHLVIVRVFV